MILTRIREAAASFPDKIAIQMKRGDQYQRHTYQDLIRIVASAARSLSEQGFGNGDRIALLSENRPEWMIAYLATVSLGAVIVPLDAQFTEKEVAVLIPSAGAKGVFVSSACRPKLPRNASLIIMDFDEGDGIPFSRMLTDHPTAAFPPAPAAADLAAILFTSGTTGDPKGVMLSQGNLASNCASCIGLNIVRTEDNMLCILPLHHTYPAMVCMLLPLSMGATVTLLNSLKGPDILACMQETKVSIMVGVPQLYLGLRRAIIDGIRKKPAPVRVMVGLLLAVNGLLRKAAGVNIGRAVFGTVHAMFGPSLRLFASGGARLEPDVHRDMTRLGFTIIEGYGLTETSPLVTFSPLSKQKPGSIGIPVPDVEVRIANPDAQGMGEIAVRGPNVMLGYYRKPQETAEVLRDGWFHTGDLGYRDPEGYFFITGRSKEMIVLSTGKKIFPEELEKFYKQIPAIKEICLIQGDRGIEAAVVPDFEYLKKMGLSNSRETIALKLEDLAKGLPPYKRITGLKIFKDPLPVTRLGKLKRSQVRDLYLKAGAAAEKTGQQADADLLADPVGKKLLSCLEPFSAKKAIVPDDNLELDLGLDSLARVEVVVSIEKTFGLSLPDSFGSEVFTVRDAVIRIRELLSAGPMKTGERVRLSWAEILESGPAEDARKAVKLESGLVNKAVRAVLRILLILIMKTCGRLKAKGLENLPSTGPYIIAPNHLSLADVPSLAAAMSWKAASQVFFLGATEYFGGPVMSGISRFFQVIPVDMDTKLFGALQLSAYVLRRGKILCVFPEGTRSRDGRIKEFKKGVGILARELNVPLVPVAIRGTYEMLPTGSFVPRPSKVSLSFGKPVYPGQKGYDEIVREVNQEVVNMLEESK